MLIQEKRCGRVAHSNKFWVDGVLYCCFGLPRSWEAGSCVSLRCWPLPLGDWSAAAETLIKVRPEVVRWLHPKTFGTCN